MTGTLPQSHVNDMLKMSADGRVHLFEMTPLAGGTIYFTTDATITWRGNTYEGIPCSFTGEESRTEGSPTPKLILGENDLDLLPLKGLVHDGHLDGAAVVRKTVLVDDIVNNRDIKVVSHYRVKRIGPYSRTRIELVTARFSSAHGQTLPFRQYLPPDFPWVRL